MEACISNEENADDSVFQEEFKDIYESEHKMIPPKILGLVTIEDVIELIINDEIYDEGDFDKQNDQNAIIVMNDKDDHDDKTPRRKFEDQYKDTLGKSLHDFLSKHN